MGLDPTLRFSDRVEDYVRYRPRYPPGLVPLLQKGIGLDSRWVVADVGSGTGFSSEPFLENGNEVIGIEPNPQMRRAAEKALAQWPRFKSLSGTAEATGLTAQTVDLVIAGQAFHWFDIPQTRREILRILRTDGWVVLFWNTRRTTSMPFLAAYEDLLVRWGTDYEKVRHDKVGRDLLERFFRSGYDYHILPNEQLLDFNGLKGRLLSTSYTPAASGPRRESMIAELRKIFDRYEKSGHIRMLYHTEVHIGKLE